jgi:threonine synthase
VVYVPTGDGVIYGGVYKGFFDLLSAGLIEKMPRLVAVQSDKSNAIARAWKSGEMKTLDEATTRADSISVASPANGRMAVEYIDACGAWAVEVSDEAITEAQLELAAEAGVFVEPAAAAAWAGFLADSDRLDPEEEAVVLLTGIGFKDMKAVTDAVEMPASVDPEMEAVEERLGKV